MRLFALPDGVIDRKDRAQWLTTPFDGAFPNTVVILPTIPVRPMRSLIFAHGVSMARTVARGPSDLLIYPHGPSAVVTIGGEQ